MVLRLLLLVGVFVGLTAAFTINLDRYRLKYQQQRQLNKELFSDIFDFLMVLPLDDMEDMINERERTDPHVKQTRDYLKSDAYKASVDDLGRMPNFKAVLDFLEKAGVPAKDLWDFYRLLQGMDPMHTSGGTGAYLPPSSVPTAPNLRLVDDLIALVEPAGIKKVYDKKMEQSEDFRKLVKAVEDDRFPDLLRQLESTPEFKALIAQHKNYGFDLLQVLAKVTQFFLDAIRRKNL